MNRVGERYGTMTVIKRAEDHISPNGRKRVMWECQCDCGNVKIVRDDSLKTIKSCGCKRNEENGIRLTKHCESKSRLYRIYYQMLRRCENPNSKEYDRYGGRGICVCEEWKKDNTAFFEWAHNNGYDEKNSSLSLERIDVDGNYCPENCSWINIKDQYNNRRNTIKIGDISLKRFCERAGLDYAKTRSKYYRTKDIVYALGFVDVPKQLN